MYSYYITLFSFIPNLPHKPHFLYLLMSTTKRCMFNLWVSAGTSRLNVNVFCYTMKQFYININDLYQSSLACIHFVMSLESRQTHTLWTMRSTANFYISLNILNIYLTYTYLKNMTLYVKNHSVMCSSPLVVFNEMFHEIVSIISWCVLEYWFLLVHRALYRLHPGVKHCCAPGSFCFLFNHQIPFMWSYW